MAEQSSFFNSVAGDRQYDMEQFAAYFKKFLSTGVYHTDNVPALGVTALTGLQTKLSSGSAFIEGFMYNNTADITFTHGAANATNPRIDRIVIRLDRNLAKRNITAVIKPGTPATNPVPPSLQRDSLIYEISVAQVRVNAGATSIASVKDERFSPDVAGLVSSLITVPTAQFEAEWRNWFTGIQSGAPAMGGMKISVGNTQPTGPTTHDIWIDTR